MLGLPKSTEFNRRLPKQKFYENLTITPTLKNRFVEDIRVIYWRNKIAASTMNLAAGQNVTEIEVFEICLSTQTVNEAILRQIDREIPYHILFLLEYGGRYHSNSSCPKIRRNVIKVLKTSVKGMRQCSKCGT